MRQGLKTAASIALATTCVATAPLGAEAGETLPKDEGRHCQVQGASKGAGIALFQENQMNNQKMPNTESGMEMHGKRVLIRKELTLLADASKPAHTHGTSLMSAASEAGVISIGGASA